MAKKTKNNDSLFVAKKELPKKDTKVKQVVEEFSLFEELENIPVEIQENPILYQSEKTRINIGTILPYTIIPAVVDSVSYLHRNGFSGELLPICTLRVSCEICIISQLTIDMFSNKGKNVMIPSSKAAKEYIFNTLKAIEIWDTVKELRSEFEEFCIVLRRGDYIVTYEYSEEELVERTIEFHGITVIPKNNYDLQEKQLHYIRNCTDKRIIDIFNDK
jgi:hypothetical protein